MPSAGTSSGRDLGLAAKSASEVPAFPRLANKKVQTRLGTPSALGYGALDARLPAIAADGTLASSGTGRRAPPCSSTRAPARSPWLPWGRTAPASGPRSPPARGPSPSSSQASTAPQPPSTSSTGRTAARGRDRHRGRLVPFRLAITTASWRPSTPVAESLRLGGKDRIATGIAVSRRLARRLVRGRADVVHLLRRRSRRSPLAGRRRFLSSSTGPAASTAACSAS